MIRVEHLTKKFPGGITAVRDVSFSVERGEVVGFLGPNGAGKSTTMRILSGFTAPTGGTVMVNGLDVTRQSLEVRRRLGYLPESCPLYPEMRVGEYLRYRAELKGVPGRHRRKRVERVMEQCGLGEVRRRPVGQLSKGFRQRVGIADALVHNPDLLILDEPTIGLDPNQIVQIRGLIRSLAQEHTLLLSTHILSEVEATCGRVIVLHEGRILESAPLRGLEQRWCSGSKVRIEVRCAKGELSAALGNLAHLVECNIEPSEEGEGWVRGDLRFEGGEDPRSEIHQRIRERGWDLRELHRKRRTLEEVFVNMTRGDSPVGETQGEPA
jgi:ABC-2 type transport system ATP-binding protein